MGGNNRLIAQDFSMLDLLLSVSNQLYLTFCGIFFIDGINTQTDWGKKNNLASLYIILSTVQGLIDISFMNQINMFFIISRYFSFYFFN